MAFAKHWNADLLVGTFTYDVGSYSSANVKRGRGKERAKLDWAEEVKPYICDESVEIAPGLVWCGEVNILPTAVRPLSGFETYTQRSSGIFPHAKLAMESVASGKNEPTKLNYTTGTVTQRNYIAKKAGQKAEFHHAYAALIVEVNHRGEWWVRQLNADDSGTFHDLDLTVERGRVKKLSNVEAITWGDIHASVMDPEVKKTCWGEGGMLDQLRPKFQFFHDILAGQKINHHEWKNPHEQYQLHVDGWDSVEAELRHAANFLSRAERPWCKSEVVYSNHDEPWIRRWLRETDYRKDPPNAITFLELQLEAYRAIRDRRSVNLLEHSLRSHRPLKRTRFLGQDEDRAICRGQIECGMHGHLGPNGARGTPRGLSKIGKRANTAHTHSAGIIDGLYTAGTSTVLSQRFNSGPSSWSHSHIVTYGNGKRAIITVWKGRFRA